MPTARTKRRTVVDFVGIGALKAGTSFLDRQLRTHPDVWLPPTMKEAEYFTRRFDRGVDWYRTLLDAPDGMKRGEISPQYLFDHDAPSRIRDLVPDVQLLVSVRDPVQRVYSQYKHWVEETGYQGSFDDFVVEHPGAVERSRYHALLLRYLELFDLEQLHVVVFEDLVVDTESTMAAVYRFLGVDDSHVSLEVHAPVNASRVPRFHKAYVRAKQASAWLYDHGGARIVTNLKEAGATRLFESRQPARFPPLPLATRRALADELRPDVRQLSALIGRDLEQLWLRESAA